MKVLTPRCDICGQTSVLEVDGDAYDAWQRGTLIQVAFPDLPREQRELLITGTHPECWKKMFADAP